MLYHSGWLVPRDIFTQTVTWAGQRDRGARRSSSHRLRPRPVTNRTSIERADTHQHRCAERADEDHVRFDVFLDRAAFQASIAPNTVFVHFANPLPGVPGFSRRSKYRSSIGRRTKNRQLTTDHCHVSAVPGPRVLRRRIPWNPREPSGLSPW